jgi:hypothetical protein
MSIFGRESSAELEINNAEYEGLLGVTDDVSSSSVKSELRYGNDSADDEDDFSEYDIEDEERPNRFQGKDSTWRTWNESEIKLYESLRQTSANSLGAVCLWWTRKTSAKTDADVAGTERSKRKRGSSMSKLERRASKGFALWPRVLHRVPSLDERFGRPRVPKHRRSSRRKRLAAAVNVIDECMKAHAVRSATTRKPSEVVHSGACEPHRLRRDGSTDSPTSTNDGSINDQDTATTDGPDGTMTFATGPDAIEVILSAEDYVSRQWVERKLTSTILSDVEKLLIALHEGRMQQQLEVGEARKSRHTSRKTDPDYLKRPDGNDKKALAAWRKRRSRDKQERDAERFPNARCWKDILSAAALRDWDSDALKLATERCKIIF